jgi:tetratricopeptide (TPR) repeat protein
MTTASTLCEWTHALVVGVEQYALGAGKDLAGPARDACRFVNWLLERRVPARNIHLFLAPLPQNETAPAEMLPDQALRDLTIREATHQQIRAAITRRSPYEAGEVLYLFWGGHGIVTTDGDRLVYYADATPADKLNLDVNDLLRFLRSNAFAGFRTQICIFDVCAEEAEVHRLPREVYPGGNMRKGVEQIALFAARPKEKAANLPKEETGLFSREVLEHLRATPEGAWPPDLDPLTEGLQRRFDELLAAGESKQRPTYLWVRDRHGNELHHGRLALLPDETDEVERRRTIIEIEAYLSKAWDLMGGKAGTETISGHKASQHELELARQLIEDHALELCGDYPKARLYLGVYYHLSGNRSKALASVRKAVQLDPNSVRAHTALGALLTEDDPGGALTEFGIALDIDPHYATAYINKAYALDRQGLPKQAHDVLMQGVTAAPNSAEIKNLYAISFMDMGQAREALPYSELAVNLEPGCSTYHANLSKVLRMLGRHDEADAAAEAALRIDPTHGCAHHERGAGLMRFGKYKEAIQDYNAAIAADPDAVESYAGLWLAYFYLDDDNGMTEAFRRALRRDRIAGLLDDQVAEVFRGPTGLDKATKLLKIARQLEAGNANRVFVVKKPRKRRKR